MNDSQVAAGEHPASEDPRTQGPRYLYIKNQLCMKSHVSTDCICFMEAWREARHTATPQ